MPLGRLTQSKMTCIKDLVDSKLFRMPQCREILLPEFCREIKEKLESKEEVSPWASWVFFCAICNWPHSNILFWHVFDFVLR